MSALGLCTLSVLLCESWGAAGAGQVYLPASAGGGVGGQVVRNTPGGVGQIVKPGRRCSRRNHVGCEEDHSSGQEWWIR